MKEFTVKKAERGQRFEKYLKRKLPEATVSFIYKMLRKKNITLNGHKAQGTETVEEGDKVVFFLSDDTYDKFAGVSKDSGNVVSEYVTAYEKISKQYPELYVLYENSEVLFLVKPAGLLSQKAACSDLSVNEWLNGYLRSSDHKGRAFSEESGYHPSAVNRLDRNTGGIVICAKTLYGSRVMSELLRDKSFEASQAANDRSGRNDTIHKYYTMVVAGKTEDRGTIEGWIRKNEADNKVCVFDKRTDGASYSRTEYRTVKYNERKNISLVEAELITGKTHQLRAHFACLGHPIAGDVKYGSEAVNKTFRKEGVTSQLLFCKRLKMPELHDELSDLSNKTLEAELPPVFRRIMT